MFQLIAEQVSEGAFFMACYLGGRTNMAKEGTQNCCYCWKPWVLCYVNPAGDGMLSNLAEQCRPAKNHQ